MIPSRTIHSATSWGSVVARIAFMFLFGLTLTNAAFAKRLTICLDPAGADSETKSKTPQNLFSGPRIGIVLEVFKRAGIPVELINDGPWKRCLHDVEIGLVDFAMGAYYDEERAKRFDYSNHYNTLSPSIFFLTSRHLKIDSASDLQALHGCGINGYSYAHYNIRAEDLDQTPDYGSVHRKLIAGHCDYFLEELESIMDGSNAVQFLKDPLIRHVPASWATAPSSYLITKKNGKNSAVLKAFNQALNTVVKSGEAARIWKEGIGEVPYKP